MWNVTKLNRKQEAGQSDINRRVCFRIHYLEKYGIDLYFTTEILPKYMWFRELYSTLTLI